MPPRAAGRATFPRAAPEAGLAPARRQEAGLAPRVDGEGHRALGLTEEREGGREREDERTWQRKEIEIVWRTGWWSIFNKGSGGGGEI